MLPDLPEFQTALQGYYESIRVVRFRPPLDIKVGREQRIRDAVESERANAIAVPKINRKKPIGEIDDCGFESSGNANQLSHYFPPARGAIIMGNYPIWFRKLRNANVFDHSRGHHNIECIVRERQSRCVCYNKQALVSAMNL